MSIRAFVEHHFRHFNAGALRDAARGYEEHKQSGGLMFVTLAGAMSTAELGISFAQLIRAGKVDAICCSGANLEEDLFNAVAHNQYKRLNCYRDLTPSDELDLCAQGLNRVTDTCIPEDQAMRHIWKFVEKEWLAASREGGSRFPHEYLINILADPDFLNSFEIDRSHSWVLAAAEHEIPIFVPGWEDSTLGNKFVASVVEGKLERSCMLSGLDYMQRLIEWYQTHSRNSSIGFFQIGGGIAGDFPICVVPLLTQDLRVKTRPWGYFCQITDAQESYGGYSGALPNEKITWGKLGVDTPKYVIHSDATIVAPLIFHYLLDE